MTTSSEVPVPSSSGSRSTRASGTVAMPNRARVGQPNTARVADAGKEMAGSLGGLAFQIPRPTSLRYSIACTTFEKSTSRFLTESLAAWGVSSRSSILFERSIDPATLGRSEDPSQPGSGIDRSDRDCPDGGIGQPGHLAVKAARADRSSSSGLRVRVEVDRVADRQPGRLRPGELELADRVDHALADRGIAELVAGDLDVGELAGARRGG